MVSSRLQSPVAEIGRHDSRHQSLILIQADISQSILSLTFCSFKYKIKIVQQEKSSFLIFSGKFTKSYENVFVE